MLHSDLQGGAPFGSIGILFSATGSDFLGAILCHVRRKPGLICQEETRGGVEWHSGCEAVAAAFPAEPGPVGGVAESTGIYQHKNNMNDPKKEIVAWLRDAHAMEANLADMLDGQVQHLSSYPELQEGVARHAEESRRHASLVESALASLGEDTSALKDGVARLAGKLSPLGIGMASDAPVKIVLANYAAEHFEIACYLSIEAAAEAAGLDQIARMCRVILSDEERMAKILEPLIPVVTTGHLNLESVPV